MMRWVALSAAIFTIVAGVAVCYQSAAYSSRTGNDAPVYSARRYDPYGTAALKELLAERGIEVSTVERPSLPADAHGVLIRVLPISNRLFGDYHLPDQQLTDWMTQGNTVVELTRHSTDLMKRFKIAPSTQPVYKDAKSVQDFEERGDPPAEVPSPEALADINALPGKHLLLWSPINFDDPQPTGWNAIARLANKEKAVVAGELGVGKGKLIIVGAPTPALNGTIGQQANLDFLLALIGKGPVLFDEWSHGIGHEATVIGFIRDAGLLPVLAQLALLAALYGWSSMGYRQPDSTAPPRQRSSIEQIETLGFLYARALSSEVTFQRIEAEVRRRLAGALRCPPGEVHAQLGSLEPSLRTKCQMLFQRLAELAPDTGPRCLSCGYNLTLNTTGRCPECGAEIPVDVRMRIPQAASNPAARRRRRKAVDTALAQVLSLSHQLTLEVQGARRAAR